MARDAQNQATNTYNQSAALTNSSEANTNSLYNTLMPAYSQEATNPQGYNPTEMADMNTAAQDSSGGGMASAVGQAARTAATDKNSGSFAPALDNASKIAQKQQSSDTLGIQDANANLKQAQTQEGLAGEAGLEGQENNDVLSSLGLQNTSTNSLTNAGNSGWFQNMMGAANAISGGGKAAGSILQGI